MKSQKYPIQTRNVEHVKNGASIDFETCERKENQPPVLVCRKCHEDLHGIDFCRDLINSKSFTGLCTECDKKRRTDDRRKQNYRKGEGIELDARRGVPVNTHDAEGNKYNNLTEFFEDD